MSNEKITGASMTAWSESLSSHDKRLSDQLRKGEADGIRSARELGLPTVNYEVFDPAVGFFDEKKRVALQTLQTETYFASLRPKTKGLPKYRNFIPADEASSFLTQKIPDAHTQEHYAYVITEFWKNHYGGIVIINADGKTHVEMKEGPAADLATGEATPQFIATSDTFTGVMKYDFEDPELRSAIWRTVKAIPIKDTASDLRPIRTPGYYEFILIKPEQSGLKPVFFDYKDNSIYSL